MEKIRVALAQIAPVWFDRARTLEKVRQYIQMAAAEQCQLVVFGEGLVPGYPFWIEYSRETAFDSAFHKNFHAEYIRQGVCIERGDLAAVCQLAGELRIAVYLGIIERPGNRGESLYAALVYIDSSGSIQSIHRKLMPTYDERLTWGIGDGHGLRTHSLGPFTVGGLNCWENWMPLARAALYAQGEDLHIAVWPGSHRNTSEITRFIAREARSFVLSVSGLMRKSDLPDHLPGIERIRENVGEFLTDGGSCVAGPAGQWLIEPQCQREELLIATLDHAQVRAERQNFDPAGHYSRPDVFQLNIDRRRQQTANFLDQP
jgi:nitrilase